MEHFEFTPTGVCSRKIDFDLTSDNKITNIVFTGGCHGNLKAIAKLCEGHDANEIIKLLKGNTCGYKNTSCADQFAIALEKALKK